MSDPSTPCRESLSLRLVVSLKTSAIILHRTHTLFRLTSEQREGKSMFHTIPNQSAYSYLPFCSCQIGGNIATNAGGLRVLRYGSLHGSVLGLEVVLPNGEILDQLSILRKDNTGYDLKQLFIGAEGSLGIITAASIHCPPAPRAQQNLVLALPSFSKLPEVFKLAKTHLSEVLSAFELFDREAYDMVSHHTGKRGLDEGEIGDSECFVLIETSGGSSEHDEEVCLYFFKLYA